jgi:hypothetical protein
MPSAQLNVLYYILYKYSVTCFDPLYDHPLAICTHRNKITIASFLCVCDGCQMETTSPLKQHIHIGYKNQLHITIRTEYTYTPHINIPMDTSCMSLYIHTPHGCCYLQTQQTNNDKFYTMCLIFSYLKLFFKNFKFY